MNMLNTDLHWFTLPIVIISLGLLLFKQTSLGKQAFNMFIQWLTK